MFLLNEQGFVVDASGRTLVGIDGAPVRLDSPQLSPASPAKKSQPSYKKVAAPSKGGAQKGVFRPKSPVEAALDHALCTIKAGVTEGTFWYVGEMTRTGQFHKCWKLFDAEELVCDEERRSEAELKTLAWALLQKYRAECNASQAVKDALLTPEQDAERLAAMDDLPSVVARRIKDAKCRAARLAKGLRSDNRARGKSNNVKKSF